MADVSDTTVNNDIFADDVKTAIKAIIESKNCPDTTAFWQYLSNKLASNIDEDYTGEILKYLVSKKILVNKRKAKGNSYEIVNKSQNKIENDMVLSDTDPEFNNEYKTPTKDIFSNVDITLDSIMKSISNLTAEVVAIKNLIIGEPYSLSRSINRVRTEQTEETGFIGDVKKIWEQNSNKNEIIKTLLKKLNTSQIRFINHHKNVDKSYECGNSRREDLKYQRIQQQLTVII